MRRTDIGGNLVRLVRKAFGDAGLLEEEAARPDPPRAAGRQTPFTPSVSVVTRPTEQANLIIGTRGIARVDDRRFALGVLNSALGGGMSSRLFQEVREKRGLAYSVYSYSSQYADTGLFGVYAGCQPARTGEVLKVMPAEERAIVRGVNLVKRHTRQTAQTEGGIISKEATIHLSNLAAADTKDGKATRVGFKTLDDGRKVRVAKRSGEMIDG